MSVVVAASACVCVCVVCVCCVCVVCVLCVWVWVKRKGGEESKSKSWLLLASSFVKQKWSSAPSLLASEHLDLTCNQSTLNTTCLLKTHYNSQEMYRCIPDHFLARGAHATNTLGEGIIYNIHYAYIHRVQVHAWLWECFGTFFTSQADRTVTENLLLLRQIVPI